MPIMAPSKAHIRTLVYHLCEQRSLPILVTDLVAEYIDERDIIKIGVLCKALNKQSNVIKFQDTSIDLDGVHRSVHRAVLILRTLLTNKTCAKNVQTLLLIGEPLSEWRQSVPPAEESVERYCRDHTPPEDPVDLSSFSSKEMELYRATIARLPNATAPSDKSTLLPVLCLAIITLCSDVGYLKIHSDYFRYPLFRHGFEHLPKAGALKTLTCSVLCLDLLHGTERHINAVQPWDNALLMPFTLPNIECILTALALTPPAKGQLRVSSITSLTLHHYQIQDPSLDTLLAATPSLQNLEYHTYVDWSWFSKVRPPNPSPKANLGLRPLYAAIHHVSDTLRSLHMSNQLVEDSPHFSPSFGAGSEPAYTQPNELSKLRQLDALTISYPDLLGWTVKPASSWDWDQVFPTSLRQITLTDDMSENLFGPECWSDEELIPVIQSILGWLATKDREGLPLKFSLLLAKRGDHFNEAERLVISQTCEEKGIDCYIHKSRPDLPKPPRASGPPRGRGVGRGLGRGGGLGRGFGRGHG